MLFKSNSFRFHVEDLPVMLGEDGISYGLNVMKAFIPVPLDFIYVVSESHFDVKPWLRDILLDLPTDESMDELAGRISLLLEELRETPLSHRESCDEWSALAQNRRRDFCTPSKRC